MIRTDSRYLMHDSSLAAPEADAQDIVKACAEKDDNMVNALSHNGTIRIELAGPPRGKGRARHGKGFTYTPAQTRAYEAAMRHEAALVMRGCPPLQGPLTVHICAHMPIPASWSPRKHRMAEIGQVQPTTKPDADNFLKTVDALNQVVWRDDAQIVCMTVVKRYSERPRLEITIVPVDAISAQAGVGRATGKRVAA